MFWTKELYFIFRSLPDAGVYRVSSTDKIYMYQLYTGIVLYTSHINT